MFFVLFLFLFFTVIEINKHGIKRTLLMSISRDVVLVNYELMLSNMTKMNVNCRYLALVKSKTRKQIKWTIILLFREFNIYALCK